MRWIPCLLMMGCQLTNDPPPSPSTEFEEITVVGHRPDPVQIDATATQAPLAILEVDTTNVVDPAFVTATYTTTATTNADATATPTPTPTPTETVDRGLRIELAKTAFLELRAGTGRPSFPAFIREELFAAGATLEDLGIGATEGELKVFETATTTITPGELELLEKIQ